MQVSASSEKQCLDTRHRERWDRDTILKSLSNVKVSWIHAHLFKPSASSVMIPAWKLNSFVESGKQRCSTNEFRMTLTMQCTSSSSKPCMKSLLSHQDFNHHQQTQQRYEYHIMSLQPGRNFHPALIEHSTATHCMQMHAGEHSIIHAYCKGMHIPDPHPLPPSCSARMQIHNPPAPPGLTPPVRPFVTSHEGNLTACCVTTTSPTT